MKVLTKLFALVCMLGISSTQILANGGHAQCENAQYTSVEGSQTEVSFTAQQGQLISGLCIKAGSDIQGDGHTEAISQDYIDACYSVVGIGTDSVVVTKLSDGPDCKDISHLDIFAFTPEEEQPEDPQEPNDPEDPIIPEEPIVPETPEVPAIGDHSPQPITTPQTPAINTNIPLLASSGFGDLLGVVGLSAAVLGLIYMIKKYKE